MEKYVVHVVAVPATLIQGSYEVFHCERLRPGAAIKLTDLLIYTERVLLGPLPRARVHLLVLDEVFFRIGLRLNGVTKTPDVTSVRHRARASYHRANQNQC